MLDRFFLLRLPHVAPYFVAPYFVARYFDSIWLKHVTLAGMCLSCVPPVGRIFGKHTETGIGQGSEDSNGRAPKCGL